ncbi:hypothetical protein HY642_00635, partial [Candidatus Woesearchaeota archaeon]|nr:hypothetical protein [Candidatus Woesearchaeota archaeon]
PGSPSPESPSAGTCNDGIDNDCDGLVDNNDPNCQAQGISLCTRTQGGLGSDCPSSHPPEQPGCFRDDHFYLVNPFVVGIGKKLTFTTSAALNAFLPQGGTPRALTQNYVNPPNIQNVLAGQVTTLKWNVRMSSLAQTPVGLGTKVILTAGPFQGMTVNQFLAIAEAVLGGSSTAYTPSAVNNQADILNNAQDGGSLLNGCVSCNAQVLQCS